MPKFTFPIPGRWQKSAPTPVASPPPSSKVEKLLGTGQLSIDSPTLPKKEPQKQWDASSYSGISISISETSLNFDDPAGLPSALAIDGLAGGMASRQVTFEQESDILPSALKDASRAGLQSHARLGIDEEDMMRSPTDTSGLRRMMSTSTIMSYYDKTKVPLEISQQTSSSAMAKGLPRKASALLDMDGSRAGTDKKKQKKKPARLDLSYLLPKARSTAGVTIHTTRSQKSLVLGADMLARSPSVLSISPSEPVISPVRPRSVRRLLLRRKSTKETLRAEQSRYQNPPHSAKSVKSTKSTRKGTQHTTDLNNLYDHYERMSFRDVMAQDAAREIPAVPALPRLPPAPESPPYTSPPLSASSKGLLSPFGKSSNRKAFSGRSSIANPSDVETPITAVMSTPNRLSPLKDYATSISSRQTRTSKNSRRTSTSIGERDLHFQSVLSLSSDSEDDHVEDQGRRPSVVAVSNATISLIEQSRSSPERGVLRKKRSSLSPIVIRPPSLRTSPVPSARHLAVPISAVPALPKPPKINPRSSSLSLSTVGSSRRSHRRNTSRLSVLSTSTMNSIATTLQPRSATSSTYGVHEARAITMVPAQGTTYGSRYSPVRTHASDQPTPPLSPTSVEFYLRSQHASSVPDHSDQDQTSLRSYKSLGTLGSRGEQRESVLASDGRFMAVSRQEEQLLAALRKKRATMQRGEFDGSDMGDVGNQTAFYTSSSDASTKPSQRSSGASFEPLPLQPKPTRVVSFKDYPMQIPEVTLPPPIVPVEETSAALEAQTRLSDATPRESLEGDKDDDRVVFYLDRPLPTAPGADAEEPEPAEPSPDLSDFMDFDDGFSSDSFPSQREPADLPPGPQPHALPLLPGTGGPAVPARTTSSGAAPLRRGQVTRRGDDVHVRILHGDEVDDAPGIPRPDTPVDAPLGLPIQGEAGMGMGMGMPRKKAVRISAVGKVGMEVGWWGDDG